MAKRKLLDKLIDRSDIKEEMVLINGSDTDYITPSGEVYKDYGENKFFHKAQWLNHGYWYTGVTYKGNISKQRRVHILVAEAFVPNPNNYPIVMHIDNNKENKHYTNLKWGTVSENTKDAYEQLGFLEWNTKSWDDSQSIHVCSFDLQGNLIKKYGSVGEASRELNVTKTTILNQCNHKVKTKPRCGYWFRYLSEYEKDGFIL